MRILGHETGVRGQGTGNRGQASASGSLLPGLGRAAFGFGPERPEAGAPGNFKAPGYSRHIPNTNGNDAALVHCIDLEREFAKLDTDAQTILLLAFREHQPQRVIAQIARCSERAVGYKIPAVLAQLARLLDRASML